jgi:hypothetical protein
MSSASPEIHEVPVDVLPPIPSEAQRIPAETRSRVPFEGLNTFYHPASGVVILGMDWLLFGPDLMTGFLALPAICVLGFLTTFPVLFAIQRKWSKDDASMALGKAFLGAFLVGLPFPITGTMLGAAILVMAGLPHHPVDAVKRLVTHATAK